MNTLVLFSLTFLALYIGFGSTFDIDQTEVIAYHNTALIKQSFTAHLVPGPNTVPFSPVSEHLLPGSVHLLIHNNSGIIILDQSYNYDVSSPESLLDKFLGKTITFQSTDGQKKGTLLHYDSQNIILNRSKTNEIELVSRLSIKSLILDYEKETNLHISVAPHLQWHILNTNLQAEHISPVDISYLTKGLRWGAEYVAFLNENENNITLTSWIHLENSAGMRFEEATLKFMAGDINEVTPPNTFPTGIKQGRHDGNVIFRR